MLGVPMFSVETVCCLVVAGSAKVIFLQHLNSSQQLFFVAAEIV